MYKLISSSIRCGNAYPTRVISLQSKAIVFSPVRFSGNVNSLLCKRDPLKLQTSHIPISFVQNRFSFKYYSSEKQSNSDQNEKSESEPSSTWWDKLFMMAKNVLIWGVGGYVVGLVVLNFVQPHSVIGSSMYPTLRFDDKVLVETFSYKSKNRQYVVGDVVASLHPTEPNKLLVKRIRATEHEIVKVIDSSGDEKVYKVPTGHVWLEGDNPIASIDSRMYGPVPVNLVCGRLWTIFLPFGRSSFIDHDPDYYKKHAGHSQVFNRYHMHVDKNAEELEASLKQREEEKRQMNENVRIVVENKKDEN